MERSELKGFTTGILLGGGIIDGKLSKRSRQRANLAYNLLREDILDTLVLSGKYAIDEVSEKTEAELLQKFLVDRGVKERQLILEAESRDTLESAVYCKELFVSKALNRKIVLITSDYHVRRAMEIFKYVFGTDYIFVGVGCKSSRLLKRFRKIIEYFKKRKVMKFLKAFSRGNHRKIKLFLRK
ncbi:YdcF family protein [Candidatus Woesearchaeota archaeon]|nr:YdcF family protein [Candidatus Woesearchaeota archaeon]